MNLKEFIRIAKKEHPHLQDEINMMYELYLNEVEEGGSEEHERSLCYEAIIDLIEHDKQD